MPRLKAGNNASTFITQDMSSVATSFTVDDASNFPETPFLVTIYNPSNDTNMEIVEVGGKSGNTFSQVLRGREGTTATNHIAGELAKNMFTAGTLEELAGIEELSDHTSAAAPHSGHATTAALSSHTGETSAHSATSAATASRIMMRDSSGRAKVAAPSASDDIARKAEVDAVEDDLSAHKADGASHSKTARFVVGTSTAGWTLEDCDYLCDGTDDQLEINNAITALPATGGEIVILDGTYNITAKINVAKDNVSIRGNGNATILKRMFNSSVEEGVITLTGRSGCQIQGLQIDGNKATYTASYNYGIYLSSSSNNNTVTGNTCNNNSYGIFLNSSSNNTITGNTCNNNSYGIFLFSSSNNTITGNTCNNNGRGIYLSSSSNNNTVTGNTCNNNSNDGISLSSSSNNTVTGNTCNNNGRGIYLFSSSNNTITGNTCIRGTGTPEDYTSSQYTIYLSGSGNRYNLISSNNCMGKAPVVGGGTGNTLVNNKFDAS